MTALPHRMYRDPAEQMLEAEAVSCKGCWSRQVDSAGTARCQNPRRHEVLADKRCEEYEENE